MPQILNDQSPHHDEAVSGSLFVSQRNFIAATPVSIYYAFAKIDQVATDVRFSNPDFRRLLSIALQNALRAHYS
jgi:hypothetical protein